MDRPRPAERRPSAGPDESSLADEFSVAETGRRINQNVSMKRSEA
jgi:hypothetical protein